MVTIDKIEREWREVDSKIRNLVEESIEELKKHDIEKFASNLESLFHEVMNSETRQSGADYLELLLKTVREDTSFSMDKRSELGTLVGISRTLDVTGHWDKALSKYAQAIELAESLREEEVAANLLRWKGHLYRKRGEWDKALECNEKSRDISRRTNYRIGEAYARNNMGAIRFEVGDIAEAKGLYEEALIIAEEEGESRLMAQVSNNMGIISQIMGDHEQAIMAYHKALPSYEREGDVRGMAQTYYNLALSFEDKGDRKEVSKSLEKSAELAGEIGERNLTAMILLRRAHLSIDRRDLDTATSFVEMALHTFQDLGDQLGVADTLRVRGVIQHKQSRKDLSLESFEESVRINRDLKSDPGLAEVLLDYGRCLMEMGDSDRGNRTLKEAISLSSSLGDNGRVKSITTLLGTEK